MSNLRTSQLLRGLAGRNSQRATFALRLGFSAATAVLVLIGASLNVTGRSGPAALAAVVAGALVCLPNHLLTRGIEVVGDAEKL